MIDIKDIENLADLARLEIPEKEKAVLAKEVDSILSYVSEVDKAAKAEVKKEVGEVRNVMRDDTNPHLPGEYSKELLEEAPRRQDDYVKVKRII